MKYLVGAKLEMLPKESGGRHCEFSAGWSPDLKVASGFYVAVRVVAVAAALYRFY